MGRTHKILFFFLTVLIVAGGGAMYWGNAEFKQPGPLATERIVVIERGASTTAIARDLNRAGVLTNSLVFRLAVRLSGAGKPLKAGEYAFPARISPESVLELLRSGRTVVRRVTFAEGLSTVEMLSQLARTPGLIGNVSISPGEGTLLPETYHFSYGDKRRDILRRMTNAMQDLVANLWNNRDEGLPLKSPGEALVLASIVEKETALAVERPRIAAVFINRLKKGMRLQSDPTVVYGLIDGKRPLGRKLLGADLKKPSPFNTYVINGLPPSPISNPGAAALEAVLRPAKSQEIYFVADGSGGHVFSKTLAEHNRNVAKWRKLNRANQ
ncbi:MAG TPA: endolytic transglycosylase MltG [Rhodospirillales bacterium]|nr:endolytic transglycosylase MltG [Rhodospirillales bacterium]